MVILSLIALAAIFTINIAVFYLFGQKCYWFYEFMHFLGGFFVAMLFSNFTGSWQIILFGLAVITFIWEFLEYLVYRIRRLSRQIKNTFHHKAEYELKDTILDIVLNFSGAVVFLFFLNTIIGV